jgi:pyruvate kinase
LSWGIIPLFSVKDSSFAKTISDVMKKGLDEKVLNIKETYILTAGDPVGECGSTNTIRLLRENEMSFFRDLGDSCLI